MRRKSYFTLFAFLIVLLLPIGILSTNIGSQNIVDYDSDLSLENEPKIASSWNLPYIHVDGNWSYTEGNYTWCNGIGTKNNPYIIENVTINANDVGSGIHIENSNVYFVIRNCTITRAPSGGRAGIEFDYVENGTIFQNNLTDNYVGIHISDSDNNTILENLVIDNRGQGIILQFSKFNLIHDNTGIRNTYYGLMLNTQSNNNTISGNTFNNNTLAGYGSGIRLNSYCLNNTIYGNTLNYNNYGIKLEAASDDNIIYSNEIENNNLYGAFLKLNIGFPCNNTLFYNNTFNNPSGINAYDNGTNTQWSLGTLGNYWHNYAGVDLNDNGIGDSPYSIVGNFSSQDNYPIWADGDNIIPTITLISPVEGTIFGAIAPTFNISIYDLNLNFGWYTINETATTYTFSASNGVNVIPINETTWDALSDGYVIIRFFANDLIGNTNNLPVNITKDLPDEEDTKAPTIVINYPLNDTIFGVDAPTFNLTIYDLSLNMSWFTINDNATKYFFSVVNGTNLIMINQLVWGALSEGSVTFKFFVNDTAGNSNNQTVTIIIDIPDVVGLTSGNGIPFGNFYLIMIGISFLILIIKRAKNLKLK